MSRTGLGALVLAAITLTSCAATHQLIGKHEAAGWTAPLAELGIDGTLYHMAQPHAWNVKQISSFDPAGGERDRENAQLKYDAGIVLADMEGPGCIMRIWTDRPWGTLYVYIDDMEQPLIITPFEDVFSGDLELFSPGFNLFGPPFVGEAGGGYYSYVPIPYERRCRLILTGDEDDLAYQVNYADFPDHTPIKSFDLNLNGDDVQYFRDWRNAWTDYDFRYHKRRNEEIRVSRNNVWPDTNYLVFSQDGPGVLKELEFSVASAAPDILSNLWLAIYFDGQDEPGVLAPMGHFFGTAGDGLENYEGYVLGNKDGRMWCRFPMPYEDFVEIRAINTSKQLAEFDYAITWQPGDIGEQRYFYARYHAAQSQRGKPIRVAKLMGEGHYAGATLHAAGGQTFEFLEGDNLFRVDGNPALAIHGTGTDDYFNGGWYFAPGPFSAPTHGCTAKDTDSPLGMTAFRSHITDYVPFRDSFTFELEHGTRNNQPGIQYETVTYWYQEAKNARTWTIADPPPLGTGAATD